MKKVLLLLLSFFSILNYLDGQSQKTFCNPVNIDYGYTPIPDFSEAGRHRATADPVIVNYKGDYYLFSTNQWGYWWSNDLLKWNYISRRFLRQWNKGYDELCAPAVGIIGDTMLVFGSTYTSEFTIWMSTNPKGDDWKPLVDSFAIGGWDPAFFTDENGRFYMYNGSSNRFPLYGIELNRKTMQPYGTRKELYLLEPWRYGWQRFGEYMDDTFLDPFIEGAWMTRHRGKYYLQYGAPGTEFSGYADGDEDIKTYWSAATGNSGEWIQSDLGSVCTVRAIQINYADQDAGVLGKSLGVYHQYRILGSKDGRRWNVLVDKSLNNIDVPHDYIELESPVQTRFLKLENIQMPTGKFSISGFRVFGKGIGEIPEAVNAFTVLRTEKDKRSAWLKWYPVDNAYAYNIYIGIAPDKLYNCIMVYNANEYWLKALDKEKPCFFSIEALNENGVGERSQVIKSD